MRHTVAQGKLKQILVSFPFLSLSPSLPTPLLDFCLLAAALQLEKLLAPEKYQQTQQVAVGRKERSSKAYKGHTI